MRELVIVIQDLYLPEDPAAAGALAGGLPRLPGLAFAARFGARAILAGGWRPWLARWLTRGDLAGVAPARIAAAAHATLARAEGTLWIAAPVHLSAGLSRVHLDHRGLLYLRPDELATLATDFPRAFSGSGFSLTAASPRELLLLTPGIEAVATAEPARFAGREVNEALPRGPAAAGLRRTWTEMEMWLHAHPINQARPVPVSALWPWGAQGESVGTATGAAPPSRAAFAEDAYVRGLWHLAGLQCQRVPGGIDAVLATGARSVLVVEAGAQAPDSAPPGFPGALAHLDERYLVPAVRALRGGHLETLRFIANDRCLSVRRGSALKFWRRGRAALAGLA